jgi:poly(A) polymerase
LNHAVIAADTGDFDPTLVALSAETFATLTAEERREKLDRILMGETPEAGLDSLLTTGFLQTVLPEIYALVGFGDGEWHHKDVWKHTKQVVTQATPRLEVRYAALFHDIGKVKTRGVTPDGEIHFLGHAEVGARMFDKLERRLQLFSNEPTLRDSVRFLILNHLRASQYDGSWTDSAVRRFTREIGDEFDNLLCLSRADITTKRPEKRRRGISYINELEERALYLAEQDAIVPPLPTGIGSDLMVAFQIPPSRLIGDIKRALENAVSAGEVESHRESSYYVDYVAEHRDRFGLPPAKMG